MTDTLASDVHNLTCLLHVMATGLDNEEMAKASEFAYVTRIAESLSDKIAAQVADLGTPQTELPARLSPVVERYRDWRQTLDAWNEASKDTALVEEEEDRWCGEVGRLCRAVLDEPTTAPDDWIFKVMAWTQGGDFALGDGPESKTLLQEARGIVSARLADDVASTQ